MNILITGCAGFIGYHLVNKILNINKDNKINIIGIDNLNNYYDVNLKKTRLDQLTHDKFNFYLGDISDTDFIKNIFEKNTIDTVINLAAQAGVRYSLDNPLAYIDSNVKGFCNILEACRHHKVKHLVYASTSSVYGANTAQPFSEHHHCEHPMALYAATKKSNELMAHSYASLFGLPCTGLRFFTVYGPWGRPDMALFKFTKNILENKPIDVYNNGDMLRDFTYVDDIVEGITKIITSPAEPNSNWDSNHPDPHSSYAPYKIYNIGNSNQVKLMDYINAIEIALDKKAEINFMPMQPGDVKSNYANTELLQENFNFKPDTDIKTGVKNFVEWYLGYYN